MADEEEYDPFAEDDDEKKKVSMTLGAGKKTKKIAAMFDVRHCQSISLSPLAPRRPA